MKNWLRYYLWDWWHGVSVSRWDEKRMIDWSAPAIEIGDFRLSKRLLALILALFAFVVLMAIFLTLARITLVGTDTLHNSVPQTVAKNVCYARGDDGRLWVAVDCLLKQAISGVPSTILGLLALVVAFVLGYTTRYIQEKKENS